MSSTYINAELRRLVIRRAQDLCEYCLIHRDDTFFGCEIDHIISEKHGGATTDDNLALACLTCNRAKGSDIASILEGGEVVRFYHPRNDRWDEHFVFQKDGFLASATLVGEVTARILGFNAPPRVLERLVLAGAGRYPPTSKLLPNKESPNP